MNFCRKNYFVEFYEWVWAHIQLCLHDGLLVFLPQVALSHLLKFLVESFTAVKESCCALHEADDFSCAVC